MPLIKSISGIRGTMGNVPGDGLTPVDIVRFVTAFSSLIRQRTKNDTIRIVIGRDARTTGPMVSSLVVGTLNACGANVIDTGLSTTPTVEMAVILERADGGIIITASHNPEDWNALKLLNDQGEFLSSAEGKIILEMAEKPFNPYVRANLVGKYFQDNTYIEKHIDKILSLSAVDIDSIRKADFTIAYDCVNSTGGIALPLLFEKLGIKNTAGIYCEPTGRFPHNPEPLTEYLGELSNLVKRIKADVGFVVDPDVDRLAIVTDKGACFGEEYTLVAVADYILRLTPGNTVSNLSSTRALQDVTEAAGGKYFASAVGEVNVVEKMKEVDAVIGGEGNGGVIYPLLHYGRDALVGIALFLSHLARTGKSCSELRRTYPDYFISKNKIELAPSFKINKIFQELQDKYGDRPISTVDGLRIEFDKSWVHLRMSNTEPILRVYAESSTADAAKRLADKLMSDISRLTC